MDIESQNIAYEGIEKVAIMLISLPEEHSRRLLPLFSRDELIELSRTMSGLGIVRSSVVRNLCEDFLNNLSGSGYVVGSPEIARKLLNKAVPEQVEEIFEDLSLPEGKTVWEKLNRVPTSELTRYLGKEHPQTIAVILMQMDCEAAAKVLAALPKDTSGSVIERIINMMPVKNETIEEIGNTIRAVFSTQIIHSRSTNNHRFLAEMINSLDTSTEEEFLDAIERINPEDAQRVRGHMFVFEDLVHLDAADMQSLIRNIERKILTIALKGTSQEVGDIFFKNMSERAAKLLKDEIKSTGLVRLRDVEEAQRAILNLAKQMGAKGEIRISKSHDRADRLVN